MHAGGGEPALELARRLKALRTAAGWTQKRLAAALRVTAPLISGYENGKETPTPERIRAYLDHLGPNGKERDRLERELLTLRASLLATRHGDGLGVSFAPVEIPPAEGVAAAEDTRDRQPASLWNFPDGDDITIVCPQIPDRVLERMPYTNPDDPDFVRLYRFGDPEALLAAEVAIQGANPDSNVEHVTSTELTSRHLNTHLVVLGGVDWNDRTKDLQKNELAQVPIKQTSFLPDEVDAPPAPDGSRTAGFLVSHPGRPADFYMAELGPVGSAGLPVLVSDVGLFLRCASPYDPRRTLMMFNGMYSRGVLGAVRSLTSKLVRDRNTELVRSLAPDGQMLALLFRVVIGATPSDWTDEDTLLYTWVEASRA